MDCLRLSYGHDGGEAEENSVREEENELLSCTQTLQVSVATDTSSQLTFGDSPGNRMQNIQWRDETQKRPV